MLIVFDTETSSVQPGQICQISYIMVSGDREVGKNFYFKVDHIDPSAAAVNGLSVALCEELSEGRVFADYAQEILDDFSSADLVVGHNVNFDICFMRAECARLGRVLGVRETFDTMRAFTPICKFERAHHGGYKYPKLTELTTFLGLTDAEILSCARDLFHDSNSYHDARFDTTATYLSLLAGGRHDAALAELVSRHCAKPFD